MTQITRKGYVFMEKDWLTTSSDPREQWKPTWWEWQVDDTPERVFVGEQTITFEIPDGFDFRLGVLKSLEAEKTRLAADYTAAVTRIDEKIANLQAIGWEQA